jgi:DNA mismatch repair protein MutL
MGFRGEALASIASVSKLVIKTKREEDLAGTEITVEGGNLKSMDEVGMSKGTQIEVHNLFFNTPARQKYLKKDSIELSYITGMFNMIALANPSVSFKLLHNSKVISDYPAVTNLISRISDIYGRATSDAMLPIFYGGSELHIEGFVGKPVISRSSSKYQFFFVNGRPIQHHVLANSIKSAFHSMLMENKKPVFVINIKIDPSLIDVNVHPRKVEIRFEDQQSVLKAVYGAVKASLEKNSLIPKGISESRSYMSDTFPVDNVSNEGKTIGAWNAGNNAWTGSSNMRSAGLHNGGNAHHGGSINNRAVQNAMDFSKSFLHERNSQNLDEGSNIKPVIQISNSYIVAENEEGLVLIDQHAAHERVRYEQLMNQFENQEKLVQNLLTPLQIEFASDEVALIEENLDVLSELGFEIEPFGGNTYMMHAVPAFFSGEDIDDVIRGVLDDISNDQTPSKFQGKTEEIITYMSCRSAIKFGKRLTMDEMVALVKQMSEVKRPYTCPHGRPTMISLTLSELEKMFGRK